MGVRSGHDNLPLEDSVLEPAIQTIAWRLIELHPWLEEAWGFKHLDLTINEWLEDMVDQARDEQV